MSFYRRPNGFKTVSLGAGVAGLFLMGIGVDAHGAQGSPAAFSGVWRHSGDAVERKQRLKAVEEATKDLSFFIRGTARDRLGERTAPPAELKLQVKGEEVTLFRNGKSISLRLDGPPHIIERDGKTAKLSVRFEGGKLILLSAGEKGQRVTTYALSPDGKRLTQSIEMTGGRLSTPLAYRASFVRKGDGSAGGAARP